MSEVCDYCFKEPEPMGSGKKIVYYFVIPKETGDPVILLSNLKLAFKMYIDKEHPDSTENMYVCKSCFHPDKFNLEENNT